MKIRDLRLLIGAAALATAGTSAGFAIAAAAAPVGVQADSICEGAWVNGNQVLYRCVNVPGFVPLCVHPGVDTTSVLVCLPN